MGANGRQRLSTDAEGAPLQFDHVLLEDNISAGGNVTPKTDLVETISDVALHFVDSLAKLFGDGLTCIQWRSRRIMMRMRVWVMKKVEMKMRRRKRLRVMMKRML